jgi:hypothetical protein
MISIDTIGDSGRGSGRGLGLRSKPDAMTPCIDTSSSPLKIPLGICGLIKSLNFSWAAFSAAFTEPNCYKREASLRLF